MQVSGAPPEMALAPPSAGMPPPALHAGPAPGPPAPGHFPSQQGPRPPSGRSSRQTGPAAPPAPRTKPVLPDMAVLEVPCPPALACFYHSTPEGRQAVADLRSTAAVPRLDLVGEGPNTRCVASHPARPRLALTLGACRFWAWGRRFVVESRVEVDRKRAQVLIVSELALRDRLASLQARTREQEEDLARVEKEVAEGLRIEFDIDTSLLGLVIGAHGQNINRVQESTGCRVVVDDEARAAMACPGPRDVQRLTPRGAGGQS